MKDRCAVPRLAMTSAEADSNVASRGKQVRLVGEAVQDEVDVDGHVLDGRGGCRDRWPASS